MTYTTDTGEVHGRKVEGGGFGGDCAAIAEGLPALPRGDVFQAEPEFAAIRKEGTAEYEVVRTGEHPPRLTHVYKAERLDAKAGENDKIAFRIKVAKGFLPRAMALGMGATLTTLRCTAIGKLRVAEAVAFERLLATEAKDFAGLVTPLNRAL